MKKIDLSLKRKGDKLTGPARQPRRSDPVPDPFADIDYDSGDLQATSQAEVSAVLGGFKDRAKRENERFTLATDSEFWFSVGFQSREQKEAFLAAMEWSQYGDKYLDGGKIAAAMCIKLPVVELPDPTRRPPDKRLAALAMQPRRS